MASINSKTHKFGSRTRGAGRLNLRSQIGKVAKSDRRNVRRGNRFENRVLCREIARKAIDPQGVAFAIDTWPWD